MKYPIYMFLSAEGPCEQAPKYEVDSSRLDAALECDALIAGRMESNPANGKLVN